ncbi:single-stranded DNA-binding protein [Ornithinimicrobium pratense]|uniref:Single-stranded DNA-binding protein n=1 Tax=Ornithinimicrobium pratense TaxID=2593973 RepID=A0A5J6V9J1_9MICO|nr:single-stranded DNA-binding protein [Ornithinimicrobium pratense]QFG70014.1 single-stranded DNA-binding protein [Ornithinimicrobium pratense]
MAGETPITVIGNLTADPELRFTPSGAAVANFTVASTPRTFDKQANEWKDGETLFMRCSVWREAAEHAAESLHRGDRVIANGRLVSRSWQTPEGENRTVMEMQVDEVGPSLRYATAQVTKAQRGQGGGGGGWQGGQSGQGGQGGWNPGQGQGQSGQGGWNQGQGQAGQSGQPAQGGQQAAGTSAPDSDPWATGGASNTSGGGQSGGWGGAPSYDEPPF